MKIVKIKNYKQAINETVETIKNGGLVVFPSDSVYGLAVDPTDKKAVKKLLGFKDRWTGKAISVAVADRDMAEKFVRLTDEAKEIYKNLLPGPFTVISAGKHKLADGIEAENGSLGIRIPDNKFVLDVVGKLDGPMTATSANLSGRRPHYSVTSFLKTLSRKKMAMIDLIIDGGKLPRNKPSTVIDVTKEKVKVLRAGDLIVEDNKSLLSKSEIETKKIAKFLLDRNKKPVVFGLSGDLGTGKTVFSKGIGEALAIKEKIKSPTFTIYNEYKKENFLHFDLYRIEENFELDEINFWAEIKKAKVVCIEWPENLGKKNLKRLKKENNFVPVTFEYVGVEERKIRW